jgi:AcrR family transcriptional regulator
MAAGDTPRSEAGGTAETLLEVTVRLLEQHGEAGLRLEDVLAEAGASPSSLYHHYGSRDGLVEAARTAMFTRFAATDIALLRQAVESVNTGPELLQVLLAVNQETQSMARAESRRRRIAVLGSAADRPALWEALGREQARLTAAVADVIADAQERGLVRRDVDPVAAATFIQAYTIGRVLSDMSAEPVDPDDWVHLIDLVAGFFVTGSS